MKILRYILYSIALLIGLFLVFLLVSTIGDYKPDESEIVSQTEEFSVIEDSIFSAVIWNLGYAGLDASMDFFYDGGKNVRPKKDVVKRNLTGILITLESFETDDFVLLQEVDKDSKRSYGFNMYEVISNLYESYHTSFAMNYNVAFVPIPLKAPMGKVTSGLQTLSSEIPSKVIRYSFPGNYAWPMSIFMLDRCFLVNRYSLASGDDLVVINTHNSAYDDGSLRKQQMEFLKNILITEYEQGNYIIVGGDWNQTPFGFVPEFDGNLFDEEDLTYVDPDYPGKDWTWAYDATTPTNRRVKTPYVKGETLTTLIDCFLLSPNLEVISVAGRDVGFTFSDHQPVRIEFKIKP